MAPTLDVLVLLIEVINLVQTNAFNALRFFYQEVRMCEKIKELKARAVLIDMEERVVNSVVQGPLRDLFEHTQTVTDVSGSGNNWAVGQ